MNKMNKGDLISRSNFEKNILQAFDSKLNEHDTELMVDFLAHLDNEPTAYNVDKVVEQLKEFSGVQYDCSYGRGCEFNDCIHTPKAIELVKAGGVNE